VSCKEDYELQEKENWAALKSGSFPTVLVGVKLVAASYDGGTIVLLAAPPTRAFPPTTPASTAVTHVTVVNCALST